MKLIDKLISKWFLYKMDIGRIDNFFWAGVYTASKKYNEFDFLGWSLVE